MKEDRKIVCLITGTSYTCAPDYYKKKCEEYGSAENLKNFFVSKKAKQLLTRGYSVQEIRNLIECVDDLVDSNCIQIEQLLAFHKVKSKKASTQNFSTHTSSSEVARLIENLKAKAVNTEQ